MIITFTEINIIKLNSSGNFEIHKLDIQIEWQNENQSENLATFVFLRIGESQGRV